MAHTPKFGGKGGGGKRPVFDIAVNPRVLRLAEAFKFKAAEMKTVTRRIDAAFRAHESKVFTTEGKHGGNPWPKLSPRYKKWKNKNARGKKIMVLGRRSRSLRKSLVTKGEGHVAVYSLKGQFPTVTVGTRDFLAAWHIKPRTPPRSVKGGSGLRAHNKHMPHRDALAHLPKHLLVYPRIWRDYITTVKLPRMMKTLASATARLARAKRI